jgi:hypothetical protein
MMFSGLQGSQTLWSNFVLGNGEVDRSLTIG